MACSNPNPSKSSEKILKHLTSLEQSVRYFLMFDKKSTSTEEHLTSLEHQLEASSSPRLRTGSSSSSSSVLYPATVGQTRGDASCVFQMPLHYPRFKRIDYESMPEWQIDHLLQEYGLPIPDSPSAKRDLAIGTFLWSC